MKKVFLGFFIIFAGLHAGITGKIAGRVIDKSTGEPLVGASIIVVGTELGASADIDGSYFIINVPVGTYTLEASMIGYTTVRVKNVKVSADATTYINFKLEPTPIKLPEVVVKAERPIIEKDVTSSRKRIEERTLREAPITDYQDVVALQAGVVETSHGLSGGLHVRGGRGGEVVYVVDGINANDPATGASGVFVDKNAIAEMLVITGGFSAEYGKALSGIVNIVTKEGGRRYSGSAVYETDRPLMFEVNGHKYGFGHDNVSLNLGGPVPVIPKLTFFASGNILEHEDRLPHNDEHRKSGTAKLTWKPFTGFKAVLSGNYANTWYHRYSHSRSKGVWLSQTPRYIRDNYQLNLKIIHSLRDNLFYTVNIGTFKTHFHLSSQDGRHYNDFMAFGKRLKWLGWAYNQKNADGKRWYDPDSMKFNVPDSIITYYQQLLDSDITFWSYYNDRFSSKALDSARALWYWYYEKVEKYGYYDNEEKRWKWLGETKEDQLKREVEARNEFCYEVNTWMIDKDTVIYHLFDLEKYQRDIKLWQMDSIPDDSVESSGNMYLIRYESEPIWRRWAYYFRPWWHDRTTQHYTADFKLTWQANKYHEIKAGAEYIKYFLDLTDVQFVNENPYNDHYHKEPISIASFIQDKFEYQDLTINAGLRFDYFDPNSEFYVDLENLDAGKAKAEPKWQLSPRIGISFSVSEKSVLYASYGHFFQPVAFRDIYQNLEADITVGVPLIGNPNLPPEKTIAYEVGYKYAFTPNLALEITAYYKDVRNLLASRRINTIYKKKLASYTIYTLEDFATIKGVDIGIVKRANEYLSGTIVYSYLNAKGTGSSAREFYYRYLRTNIPPPKTVYPLEFDVTHTVKANINFYFPRGYMKGALFGVLSDLNINAQFSFASGAPYTPTDEKGNLLEPNSKRMPPSYNIDTKITKGIYFGKTRLGFYVDIRNLLNLRNIRSVYSRTGLPNDPGNRPKWEPSRYQYYADMYPERFSSAWDAYLADLKDWEEYYDNPLNYSDPITIKLGFEINF